MTPEEETALKQSILKLEEERADLIKKLETRADKTEIQKSLDELKAQLATLRAEYSASKAEVANPAHSLGFFGVED